jgi:hypothetical protein
MGRTAKNARKQVSRLIDSLARKGLLRVSNKPLAEGTGYHRHCYRINYPLKSDISDKKEAENVPFKSDISDMAKGTFQASKRDISRKKPAKNVPLRSQSEEIKKKSSSRRGVDDDFSHSFSDNGNAKQTIEKQISDADGTKDGTPIETLTIDDAKNSTETGKFENDDDASVKRQGTRGSHTSPCPAIDLKRIYAKVPPATPLNRPPANGKKLDLSAYVGPFSGRGAELSARFGFDIDGPPPFEGWLPQFESYYSDAVRHHWNRDAGKPREGFKVAFRRACLSGALKSCGFNPLTPAEIEAQRQAERKLRETEKAKLQLEKERQIEKDKKIAQHYAEAIAIQKDLPDEIIDLINQEKEYAAEHRNFREDIFLIDAVRRYSEGIAIN